MLNYDNTYKAKRELEKLIETKFELFKKLRNNEIEVEQTFMSSMISKGDYAVVVISTDNQEVIKYLDSDIVKNIIDKYQTELIISPHPGKVIAF